MFYYYDKEHPPKKMNMIWHPKNCQDFMNPNKPSLSKTGTPSTSGDYTESAYATHIKVDCYI